MVRGGGAALRIVPRPFEAHILGNSFLWQELSPMRLVRLVRLVGPIGRDGPYRCVVFGVLEPRC
jgi:hypothetical protein